MMIALILLAASTASAVQWKPLQPGVELAVIAAGTPRVLYVVRVDPARAPLDVALASESGTGPQTAAQWCRTAHLAVAINAGMFQPDQRSNVGYLRHGSHVNNARVNDYRSVLALRPFAWLDLDRTPTTPVPWGNHETLIQNLRLIAANRKNVWAPSPRRWSEAALALDSSGRLLFLFSRAPYSMRDFNGLLLALPLNVTRAMHLEGGPEASLSIHVRGFDLDLCDSFETGFREDDGNAQQWPIPNVLGVRRTNG